MLAIKRQVQFRRIALVIVGLQTMIGHGVAVAQDDATIESIFAHMGKLRPMIGHWNAVIDYHNRDGSVEMRGGDYDIHPVLENTYLQSNVTIFHRDDHSKQHSFVTMTTFNPDTNKYDGTYFYSRWALRVTETGTFDDAKQEYDIDAFVPKEDGVHDETVRSVTTFNKDGTIDYWHWSRYDNEKAALMNFHAKLTRVK